MGEGPHSGERSDWHCRQVNVSEKWHQHRGRIFSSIVTNEAPPLDEPCFLCENSAVIRLVEI